jgi:hypothetical protein
MDTRLTKIDLHTLKYVKILSPKDSNYICIGSSSYTNIIYDNSGYNSYIRFIIHMINNRLMCGGILSSYINESIAKCDYLCTIMIFDGGPKVIGFALFNIENNQNVYVDLMCCSDNKTYKNVGSEVMNMIKEISIQYDFQSISLNAINDVNTFYYKQGFINNNTKISGVHTKPMTFKHKKRKGRITRKI